MVFRLLILLGTAVGVLRDYFFVSDESALVQIVFTLFIAEMVGDLILRLVFLRVFNIKFQDNPVFTSHVFFMFGGATLLVGALLTIVAQMNAIILWWAGIYVIVLSTFKYFFTALIILEKHLLAQSLEILRVFGVTVIFFFSKFMIIPLFVLIIAIFSFIGLWHHGWMRNGSASETIKFLKSRRPELLVQIQALFFIGLCILEKSFIDESSGHLLLMTLAMKVSIVSVGLFNRLVVQPAQIDAAKSLKIGDIDSKILRYASIFAISISLGFLFAFLQIGPYFSFDIGFVRFEELFFLSLVICMFLIREGGIRVLLRRDQPVPVGISGVIGSLVLFAYLVLAQPNLIMYCIAYTAIMLLQALFYIFFIKKRGLRLE